MYSLQLHTALYRQVPGDVPRHVPGVVPRHVPGVVAIMFRGMSGGFTTATATAKAGY